MQLSSGDIAAIEHFTARRWDNTNEMKICIRHQFSERTMMTSSNGNIFRVTGPLRGEFTGPGEFPAQRPVPRSFDVFFDLSLNKRLSKQPWGWWFETPPRSLWRQCNGLQNMWGDGNLVCIVGFYFKLRYTWRVVNPNNHRPFCSECSVI